MLTRDLDMGDGDICPGCGLRLPVLEGERHAYLGASAACWALFGQVLAREYADPAHFTVHGVTVDAYAAQHPGAPEPRTVQSLNVHLVGLYLSLQRRLESAFIGRVRARLTLETQADKLSWLTPPADLGRVTVADVAEARGAAAHVTGVTRWGAAVWAAWSPHHAAIINIAERSLASL